MTSGNIQAQLTIRAGYYILEMLFNEKELKSLVSGKSREEILGDGGILKGLIKSLIEAGNPPKN